MNVDPNRIDRMTERASEFIVAQLERMYNTPITDRHPLSDQVQAVMLAELQSAEERVEIRNLLEKEQGKIRGILEQGRTSQEKLEQLVNKILDQTTLTNGRVTWLEEQEKKAAERVEAHLKFHERIENMARGAIWMSIKIGVIGGAVAGLLWWMIEKQYITFSF